MFSSCKVLNFLHQRCISIVSVLFYWYMVTISVEVGKYLTRSIRALFDCVSSFLMCKTGQVQVEQIQSNLEINCMLDVKMNTYLEMPKKICTPPPQKKKPQNNKTQCYINIYKWESGLQDLLSNSFTFFSPKFVLVESDVL